MLNQLINQKTLLMKRLLILLLFVGLIAVISCQREENLDITSEHDNMELTDELNGTPIEGQYIVVLNEGFVKASSAATYTERLNNIKAYAESMFKTKAYGDVVIEKVYAQVLKGFSVKISAEDADKLANDSRVKYLEQDMHIMRPPWERPDDGGGDNQEVPYGITRVGYGDGTGKVAWIIDSGIDLDHPDLNVDVARSADFTGSRKGADDENGHGTHCAGTVAAIDNEIGVVGVAAGASVVAVKVLNRRGSGTTSGVIAGVDYVAANAAPGDAANMSLGGGVSPTLDNAVINASNNGIFFALAAGNEGDDASSHSPARANGQYIWTISAMDINDDFAYFSNYGNPPVDFCEPGVSIKSTYKGGGYSTMSGTSMAAPHMCGILLMTNGNPKTSGYVSGDPDGNADPIGAI